VSGAPQRPRRLQTVAFAQRTLHLAGYPQADHESGSLSTSRLGWDPFVMGGVMSSRSIAATDLRGGDTFENSIRDVATQNAANLRRVNSIAGDIDATNLSNLIGRLSDPSLVEIDRLVCDLAAMREHLEDERDRVQCAIMEFARLSQSSVASTNAITGALQQMFAGIKPQ
jgi:hypothetical protein